MPILSPVCDRCSYCSRRYDDPFGGDEDVSAAMRAPGQGACVCIKLRPQSVAAYAANTNAFAFSDQHRNVSFTDLD